jgi:hypothetical protein
MCSVEMLKVQKLMVTIEREARGCDIETIQLGSHMTTLVYIRASLCGFLSLVMLDSASIDRHSSLEDCVGSSDQHVERPSRSLRVSV